MENVIILLHVTQTIPSFTWTGMYVQTPVSRYKHIRLSTSAFNSKSHHSMSIVTHDEVPLLWCQIYWKDPELRVGVCAFAACCHGIIADLFTGYIRSAGTCLDWRSFLKYVWTNLSDLTVAAVDLQQDLTLNRKRAGPLFVGGRGEWSCVTQRCKKNKPEELLGYLRKTFKLPVHRSDPFTVSCLSFKIHHCRLHFWNSFYFHCFMPSERHCIKSITARLPSKYATFSGVLPPSLWPIWSGLFLH